ncbi:hypothetical protein SDC9_159617 [bioreactor metagenome]|uniref:Uncharacterized protein n=1 Tax=bioreactor metagenome TaxID=1076179 RepID=A0A645FD73_9ZZZZ
MTSASTVGLPEDKAYIAHHFNCPTCCAAGRSGGKQTRCPDGQRLWDLYLQAFQAQNLTLHPLKNRKPREGLNF